MIKHYLGIAAGKGGVGKSTVTVNLAIALNRRGLKVGILDADLYGPSIPHMLPADQVARQSSEDPEKIIPAISQGIKLISMAYFRKEQEATIIRAPIANATIQQFLHAVEWGDLDILLIDFPPGTGDIQLSIAQQAHLTAALIVTLPQKLSLIDVRKATQLFEYTKVPLLGIVENMSGLFSGDAAFSLSQETSALILAQLPYDQNIFSCADSGKNLFDSVDKSPGVLAFEALAQSVDHELNRFSCIDEDVQFALKDSKTLSLVWRDGLVQEIDTLELQQHCPCMRCRSTPVSIGLDGKALSVMRMGRYALSIQFNSGCSRGIFPLVSLRSWKERIC